MWEGWVEEGSWPRLGNPFVSPRWCNFVGSRCHPPNPLLPAEMIPPRPSVARMTQFLQTSAAGEMPGQRRGRVDARSGDVPFALHAVRDVLPPPPSVCARGCTAGRTDRNASSRHRGGAH
ncbi:hypothetical protein MTO96_008314 [Rhipicephalus appendiculatus]